MKFTFLGTGAADWDWQSFPPGTRGSCTTLLDDTILIDAGPTALENFSRNRVSPDGLTDILITHSHSDHFSTKSIAALARDRQLTVHATHQALLRLGDIPCRRHALTLRERFTIGDHAFTVLPANHALEDPDENAFHFLIDTPERRALYALDGGWILSNARIMLAGRPIDTIVWDATSGPSLNDWRFADHNDLGMIDAMRQALLQLGYITPATKHVLDHIAWSLWPQSKEECQQVAARYNAILAEDGMTIEF